MAYLGSLAALGYGALKATWALGGTLGLQDPARFHATEHGFSGGQRFAAYWGTVILRPDLLERLQDDLLRHASAPLDGDAALILVRVPAIWGNLAPQPAQATAP